MNILLTGASRGIGAAAASALSAHAVFAHSSAIADLADPAAPRRLWDRALGELGDIDVLVCNAGVFEAIDDSCDDEAWHAAWARTMQINLQAAADLARLAILRWRERGRGGRIVNVASRAGYRGDSPRHWHYAASKAGMIAMTKTIARGYAKDGILAFAVCPGFTVTGMVDDYLASRGGEALLADIPLGRPADASEIGEIIRWLAIDAPASATGAIVDANGASYVR
ncbi:SDR family oxidoreductase [Sphingomonas sp. ASV193]|uniref:SDR family NAD(P)-dependent oxidoreductase n=1 Tax=Sphingomonas sp. ASV193 TaxID=3144405 RepID=UPI0032E8BB3D